MKKGYIIALIAVVAIIVAVVLVQHYHKPAVTSSTSNPSRTNYTSEEFVGQIKKVSGETLVVSGIYRVDSHPELFKQSNAQLVIVKLSSGTIYKRSTVQVPPLDQLKQAIASKSSGTIIKSQTAAVTAAQFAKDVAASNLMISAKASSNVYTQASFDATEIDYTAPSQ